MASGIGRHNPPDAFQLKRKLELRTIDGVAKPHGFTDVGNAGMSADACCYFFALEANSFSSENISSSDHAAECHQASENAQKSASLHG